MKKIISLLLVVTLVASCGLLVGCKKGESVSKKANEVASVVDEVATQIMSQEGVAHLPQYPHDLVSCATQPKRGSHHSQRLTLHHSSL